MWTKLFRESLSNWLIQELISIISNRPVQSSETWSLSSMSMRSMIFTSKSQICTTPDMKFHKMIHGLLTHFHRSLTQSTCQGSILSTLLILLTLKSPERSTVPLFSQLMTRTSFSLNITCKSGHRLILLTSTVLEKDSSQVSERLKENGPFSTGIEDRSSIMDKESKLMDIIQSILPEKEPNISTSIIWETQMPWMLLLAPLIARLMLNTRSLEESLISDFYWVRPARK